MGAISRFFAPFRRELALNSTVLLLLLISFFATWRGLSDFISVQDGLDSDAWLSGLVLLIVLALTLAMYVCLREMMRWRNWKRVVPAILAMILYAVLALWSVGFGYGFWWSLIAGQATSESELSAALEELEADIVGLSAQISSAQTVMSSAVDLSEQRADQEASRGGSCGVNSGQGEGPLFRARMETNQSILAWSRAIDEEWAVPVATSLRTLRADMAELSAGQEQAQLSDKFNRARQSVGELTASAEVRGASFAALLRAKADQLDDPPEQGLVDYCYDPDLASALESAADALSIRGNPNAPEWSFSGGAEGVARSIELLWRSVFAFKLPELDGRSLIALLIASATDLALFVFAFFQASAEGERRRLLAQKANGDVQADLDRIRTERDVMEQSKREIEAELAQARQELAKAREQMALDVSPDAIQWVGESVDSLTAHLQRLRVQAIGDSANRELDDLQEKLDDVINGLKSMT